MILPCVNTIPENLLLELVGTIIKYHTVGPSS